MMTFKRVEKNFARRLLLAVVLAVVGTTSSGYSQEVIVTGFPAGVGGSVDPGFFEPYYSSLQSIADSLAKYPSAMAIVTGGADGERYRNSNDAKNPGLALGRAHALSQLLIIEFKVDPVQISVQSQNNKTIGEEYRFAKVRLDLEWSTVDAIRAMQSQIYDLQNMPPVEPVEIVRTEVTNNFSDLMEAQIGAGVISSPFGGIPMIAGGITWKRTFVIEGVVGHTFWNNSFFFEGEDLDTKRRIVGGQVAYYPFQKKTFGFTAGWLHVEELSDKFIEYVRMSEGPFVGIRLLPSENFSITGAYNPSRRREAGSKISSADNDQFFISVSANKLFGGRN